MTGDADPAGGSRGRTVAAPAAGEFARAGPRPGGGIRINGIPADLDRVRKADVRIDLVGGDESDDGRPLSERGRAFVAEHVLGPLRLHGVTDADVVGTDEHWSFARPEHRFCYAAGLAPDAVVGHPDGLPNPALAAAVADAGTEPTAARARGTVAEPMTFAVDGGEIRIEPRPFAAGAVLDLAYGDATFACELPPGGADPGTVTAVTGATTPYLAPDDEEAVTHAVADVVSDVVVLGGLEDVRIEATLGDAYHALTVGAARAARERGLYRERTADGGTRGDGGSGPGPDSGSGTGTGTETGDPE